ncbi:MAG TPA: glycosyl hydrolase, partial [Bacteroidia bacterium]|nr:glycosyl hydrolase [Bacteroidia bacterium]
MKKFVYAVWPLLFFAAGVFAQSDNNRWTDLWQTPAVNYYSVKHAFDSVYADKDEELHALKGTQATGSGDRDENEDLDGMYFQFKRWEYFMQPRLGPNGETTLPATTYQRFMDYLQSNPAAMAQHNASVARTATSNSWSFVGPTGAPTNSGAGRVNCVRFDPNNTNIIYIGAPAGGLWKSINGGSTWTCLTDYLPVIGCSDVAIDPTNSNIIYIATGDRDAGDSPSIGVMKSTDGGITWNTTGLMFNNNQGRKVARLLIDPGNPNILFAATSGGIYKTQDAGVNWYQMSSLNTMDMEFKPGDPNTIYACKTALYTSTNGGITWSIAAGLPPGNQLTRISVAVSPAAPDNVYVLASLASDYGYYGLYVSTNDGVSFSQRNGSPNLLGWNADGGDSGGQGWYDLSIAVAPYDANTIIVGGVNIWRSDDGGYNFYLNAHWYGGGGAPYVHADCHDLIFEPGTSGSYFAGCDGGIFHTGNDGASFEDLSNNLCIAQIYRVGLSQQNAGTLITGHQDNGTNVKVGSNYFSGLGGDGMDCFIDRTNDNNMFGELYYGDFYRSTNGGASWNGITNGLTGSGGWVTPWVQDPVDPNTLYAGYDQVFRSTDLGSNWSPTGSTMIAATDIQVAPSNHNYLYVTSGLTLLRSTDAGATFSNITFGINSGGASISRIAVCPYDEKKLWVSISGYNNNQKVYYSSDAGATWTNISYGLPNIPANCITAVPGSMSDAIFVGCDVGVYYHDNSMAGWQPYFTGLPNVPVYDLKIYKPAMLLRAATYGRGVWECQIDQSVLVPQAGFSANATSVCPGTPVQFTDLSTLNPVA